MNAEKCGINNLFCSAKCLCDQGFSGQSCSQSVDEVEAAKLLNGQCITALGAVTALSSVSSDMINLLGSSLAAVTEDFSLVAPSMYPTVMNSTLSVITGTVYVGSSNPDTLSRANSVFSKVLGNVPAGDSPDQSFFSNFLGSLGDALLLGLVPGQQPQTSVSLTVKVKAGVFNYSVIGTSTVIDSDLSPEEIASGSTPPAVDLGNSLFGVSNAAIALTNLATNPFPSKSNTSTKNISSSVLQLALPVEANSLNRAFRFNVTLKNTVPETSYVQPNITQVFVNCVAGDSIKTTSCNNHPVSYNCGGKPGIFNLTCTHDAVVPSCLLRIDDVWDTTSCVVLSYDSMSTLCACTIQQTVARRLAKSKAANGNAASGSLHNSDHRNSTNKGPVLNVGSALSSIGGEIGNNFANFNKPFTDPSVVKRNFVVFVVQGSLFFGVPIFAALNFFFYRWSENKQMAKKAKEEILPTTKKQGRLWEPGEKRFFFTSSLGSKN